LKAPEAVGWVRNSQTHKSAATRWSQNWPTRGARSRRQNQQGLAGQELASSTDIRTVTAVATAQLNAKAKPWIWGRPPPPKRVYRLKMTYRI
jgi:hypothetical protein